MGEKLKVQELEVGKVYLLYNNNDEYYRAVFIINKQGDLLEGNRYRKNENFFKKSSISYNKVKNGYFKEIEREIDWSKVDSGTKVQVRNNEDSEWANIFRMLLWVMKLKKNLKAINIVEYIHLKLFHMNGIRG